MKLISDDILV